MRSFTLAALLLLALLLTSVPSARAQAGFRVSGAVVNGSTGGTPIAQATVTLESVTSGATTVAGTAITDSAGGFVFDNLSGGVYRASVSFEGVSYRSADVSVSSAPADPPNITVYEASEDGASLAVERMSVVLTAVDSTRRLLTFVESYRFDNGGSDTYVGRTVGGERESLRFALMTGAQSLVALGGFGDQDARAIPGGFALTSPVPPGETTIAFTYDLALAGSTVQLHRAIVYPTSTAQFVLPDGVDATSAQLPAQGTLALGARTFRTLESGELAAGSAMDVTLTDLPAPSRSNWETLPVGLEGLILAGILAFIAACVVVVRRRAQSTRASLMADRLRLLREVLLLDEQAVRGEIDAEHCAARRQADIEAIRAIDLRLRKGSGDALAAVAIAD